MINVRQRLKVNFRGTLCGLVPSASWFPPNICFIFNYDMIAEFLNCGSPLFRESLQRRLEFIGYVWGTRKIFRQRVQQRAEISFQRIYLHLYRDPGISSTGSTGVSRLSHVLTVRHIF